MKGPPKEPPETQLFPSLPGKGRPLAAGLGGVGFCRAHTTRPWESSRVAQALLKKEQRLQASGSGILLGSVRFLEFIARILDFLFIEVRLL